MSNSFSTASAKTLEFQRLEFPMGWGETGAVFLRIRIYPDQTFSFFCSKATNSGKTNITNSFERIFEAAVQELAKEGVIPNPAREDGTIRSDTLATIAKRSVWVEYKSADETEWQIESFAIVATDNFLNPSWSYIDRATAAKVPGLDEQFLAPPTKKSEIASSPDANAIDQLDDVYFALKNAAHLLKKGRSFGIQIGLTVEAKNQIKSRHGQDASVVLENCITLF